MRNIKLTYSYDGTDFFGFQRQPNSRTVQGEIEKVLFKLTNETEINLISSGRTDSGVHAFVQVSNFITHSTIPTARLLFALNNALPTDIKIDEVQEVDLDFNSRFNAKDRTYKYFFTTKKSPFSNRFATYINHDLDITKFVLIMQDLIGRHDFSNFRLADCSSKNQIREIHSITGTHMDIENFCIEIQGNAFLKSQIRIIIGTALEIYLEKKPKDYFKTLIQNPTIYYPKIVAPPNGLFLSEVKY